MSAFFDTSVLIAAFVATHERHKECNHLIAHTADPVCAMHSLAEFYSNTTAFPPRSRLTPEEAVFLVDQIADRFQVISLTAAEYRETLHRLAASGHRRGRTYDALLLACARKAQAEKIYTLDRDFEALAPDLKDRIRTP